MLGSSDMNYSLISTIRDGNLERVSYSPVWPERYVLLREAIKNGESYENAEIAKKLLTSGSKVNSKSKNPFSTPLHFDR